MNDLINIEEIIELVRQQEPERPDIIEALQKSSDGRWTSNGYYRFADGKNANQIGAKSQFDKNIVLEQENKGDIVLTYSKMGE